MAVPTVLIGCLPTYAHVGVAAPVLLSLLRLVQGVAMGGEFGSALVSGTHTPRRVALMRHMHARTHNCTHYAIHLCSHKPVVLLALPLHRCTCMRSLHVDPRGFAEA